MIAFCNTSLFAQGSHQIIRAVDSNDDTHYYYYNAQNQLFWEVCGTTRREYTYNNIGQCVSMLQKAWVSADNAYVSTALETYEYDAQGNLSIKVVDKTLANPYGSVMTYKYSDYQNGVATYYDEYKNNALYYMYKQVSEFDANNRQISCTVYYADPDNYTNPTHESVDYKDVDQKYSKTYDADGFLIKENKKSTDYEYTYTDLKPAYSPLLVTSTTDKGEATINWSSVAGAEKYVISYNTVREEVEGTSYVASLPVGKHLVTIQAVIDGMERNAVTPVEVEIKDDGMVAATNLAAGTIFVTEEATESADLGTRTFINIPLTWSVPANHSEIVKFYVYYNSRTYGNNCYVAVTDPNATSFTLRVDPFEVAELDEDGVPAVAIETPIYVTIVYKTGESEKSNVVTVSPFAVTGINSAIASENASCEYNLAGMRVAGAKGVVIKNGKKTIAR